MTKKSVMATKDKIMFLSFVEFASIKK